MTPMEAFTSRFGYAPAIIVPRIAAMVAVLVFTRILPPEQFGLYALVIVYGELLDSVALSWARLGVQRFHHVVGIDTGDLLRKAASVSLVGASAGALLAVALVLGSAATRSWPFYAMLLLYFFGAGLLRQGLNLLRAQERVLPYVLIECARPLVGLLVGWMLAIHWDATFVPLSVGNFGITALFALGLLVVTARLGVTGGHKTPLAEFLRYSAPLAGVFLVSQGISASDRYLLGAFGGAALVGIYAACTAIARPPIETLFNIVNTAAFPRLVRAYEEQGEAAAARELQEQLGTLVLLGLPALVGLWLVARPISEVLLDPRYHADAAWLIRLSSLAAFLANTKCFFSDQVFHLRKNSLLQTVTLVPGASITLVGCWYAIPEHGGVGAAASLLAGYTVSALLSFWLARRYLPIRLPWRMIVRSGAGCAAMVAVGQFALAADGLPALVVSIVACATTYGVVCFGYRAIRVPGVFAR